MLKSPVSATLLTMQQGRPFNLGGCIVERLRNSYRINRESRLLTIGEAIQRLESMPQKSQKAPKVKREAISTAPLFPREQRAITTHFPWAYLMANGFKLKEYRSKPTNLRGMVFLHAGASTDSDSVIQQFDIPQSAVTRKRIIGAATIVDCEQIADDEYAYVLEDTVYFPKPTDELPGQQSIFWGALSPERFVAQRVRAFNQAWLMLQSM